MRVEVLEEHEKEAGRNLPGLLSRLHALPERYPVAWAMFWMGLVLVMTLAPSHLLPQEPRAGKKGYVVPRTDLAIHCGLFVGFAWSWLGALGTWRRWWVIVVAGVLLAAGTEIAQGLPFIQRDPGLDDGLADCAGLAVGLIGGLLRMSLHRGAARERETKAKGEPSPVSP